MRVFEIDKNHYFVTSSHIKFVPETQTNQETTTTNPPHICLVLQKDLDLIKHFLVNENENLEAPFTPYLTKNQKDKIHQNT